MSRSRLLPLTGIAAALAAWQIAVMLRPSLIPGPIAVAEGIGELAVRGLLDKYVVASYTPIPTTFQDAISFSLLVIVLVLLPQGLPRLFFRFSRRLRAAAR